MDRLASNHVDKGLASVTFVHADSEAFMRKPLVASGDIDPDDELDGY